MIIKNILKNIKREEYKMDLKFEYKDELYELAERISSLAIMKDRYVNKQALIEDIIKYLENRFSDFPTDEDVKEGLFDPNAWDRGDATYSAAVDIWDFLFPIKDEKLRKLDKICGDLYYKFGDDVRDAIQLLLNIGLAGIVADYKKFKEEYRKKRL